MLNWQGVQEVELLPTYFPGRDEAGILQHAQVLHHPEARHRERRLKLPKRAAITLEEPVEQQAAVWVSKSAEDPFIFHAQHYR